MVEVGVSVGRGVVALFSEEFADCFCGDVGYVEEAHFSGFFCCEEFFDGVE